MKRLPQKGFALFEMVVIAALLTIVVLGGWNIYERSQKPGSVSTSKTTSLKAIPEAPAELSSTADLTKASETLDEVSLDSDSETAQLDKELASF
ncbi:hypothetical protein HYW36_00960 [Candidatus Saccharibacteria bacterium]|nr:hypothetical protein [Candidatus Saccharibacteria bacterium]